MSLDGKLLKRARDRLDARRKQNEEAAARRREEVYDRNPRIRELDRRLRETVARAVTGAFSGGTDPVEALDAIREENLELQERRAMELIRMGLPVDYLDDKYICPRCRDTGYDGTELCSCLMDLYKDEQRKDLSQLLKLGEQTFDSFDLNLYDDTPDPATGVSPRSVMTAVYDFCSEYAGNFSPSSLNLFLQGGTGLGKTSISTCIARVVSERGWSVVYETAGAAFAKYEAEKFGRGDPDELRRDIRRMETCDLLILDDLGTEFATSFVTSALYTLLNTRLASGKKTVISSNLTLRELSERYSAPIMSRLTGEFYMLKFVGTDLRGRGRGGMSRPGS